MLLDTRALLSESKVARDLPENSIGSEVVGKVSPPVTVTVFVRKGVVGCALAVVACVVLMISGVVADACSLPVEESGVEEPNSADLVSVPGVVVLVSDEVVVVSGVLALVI